MDMRYMEFLSPGKLFYELAAQNPQKNDIEDYVIQSIDLDNWISEKEIDWQYCINKHEKMPKQGWKIHISTELSEAQKTLDNVVPYLIKNNISFKYVPNEKQLLFKNSKNGDRASTGKFITIYPANVDLFLELLNVLEELTKDLHKGTYILNDKRWKDSNVYFRYGAFVAMYLNKDGQKIPAIEKPDGTLVEDLRVPYYEVPDFIEEPDVIKKMSEKVDLDLENEDTSKFDEYEVSSALHFSNGGGVYKVEKNGETFVMKEGRYGAGLDRHKVDSYKRIKNEADNLKKLNQKFYTTEIYDYFEVWENNYLIEEYIDAISLMDYVAQNFPFSERENKVEYTENMIKVLDQLIEALNDLHANNIALGDLQPSNVLVLDDFSIKLIDLETATTPKSEYSPALMTPGYVTEKAKTFEAADWYALLKIARFLFLPIENLADLSIDIEVNQDIWIEENFGISALKKINSIKSKTDETIQILKKDAKLTIPPEKIELKSIDSTIEGLRKGIISNLDISSKSLIHGDIRQFTEKLGGVSISNGGFGGIMALERSGELPDVVYKWVDSILDNTLLTTNEFIQEMPIGLFNGLSGISSVLYDIGYEKKSLEILSKIPLKEDLNQDLTLYSGLAGVGLNYLSFYTITKDEQYLEKATSIGRLIVKAFNNDTQLYTLDVFGMPHGLLNGWSGISLFILHLSLYSNDLKMKKIALDMLEKELNENIEIDEKLGLAQIKEYSLGYKRVVPYLGEGAAGIALTMLEFSKHFPNFMNTEKRELTKKLLNVTDLYSTFASGIFRGAGGMIILANANNTFKFNHDSLNTTIKALGNYLLYKKDQGILSPGEYGYRLSLDLQTGNSGLILALNDIGKNKWNSWIPIPKTNTLNLFTNETNKAQNLNLDFEKLNLQHSL